MAIDLSTNTGWAVLENRKLLKYGLITLDISDFDINGRAHKNPAYPYNFIDKAESFTATIRKLIDTYAPEVVILENTVLGRNRHAQRMLEFLHYSFLKNIRGASYRLRYMDPSEWRKVLEMRMNDEQKAHNKLVKAGTARGKITKKHLSVQFANKTFGLSLIMKDNDMADAIGLGLAGTIVEKG
jgi:Holliday junction resolvasome RuvABC endonuclease subunit